MSIPRHSSLERRVSEAVKRSRLKYKSHQAPRPDQCPLQPALRTKAWTFREVREVRCVDGSELARVFFTSAGWSVQPCVRPVSAAHKAAGHNALRGSGPGQKPAFDNALARMGCPDRRIDRLHYVLFALPTFTSRRMAA